MRRIILLWSILIPLLSAADPVPPGMINYQGYVERDGAALTGSADMTFAVVDDYGIAVWNEARPDIAVEHGFYSVVLGSVSPIAPEVFARGPRFLQVTIDGEVLPDRRLVSVPYALVAPVADGAVTTDKIADGAVTAEKLAPGVRFAWRGAWIDSVAYQANDVVAHGGSAWIAIGPSQGIVPGVGAAWQVFARGPSPTAGSGIAISGSTVSVDATVARTDPQGLAIVGRYRYATPHRMTAVIAAAGFHAESIRESISVVHDGGCWRARSGTRANDALIASVALPAGAVVVGFSATISDGDASANFAAGSVATLHRLRIVPGAPAPAAALLGSSALTTTGVADVLVERSAALTASAATETVAHDAVWVRVSFDADAASTALRFYGCRLDYEVPAVP